MMRNEDILSRKIEVYNRMLYDKKTKGVKKASKDVKKKAKKGK